MEHSVPITLIGDNLNERYRYFNKILKDYSNNEVNISKIPENSTIDRIFKIELAVRTKNVDYIVENLKDDDMLYVSKALKAVWLLDPKYQDIINPVYLESELFPYMTTTAVNKMKHWIILNLKDEDRSELFYKYYSTSTRNTNIALKFLTKCRKELIVQEFSKYAKNMNSSYLKIFCEKAPIVSKMFYEAKDKIKQDEYYEKAILNTYKEYFKSVRCVLNQDIDTYLDIVEEHFIKDKFTRLSTDATKHIITNRKERVLDNGEFYAGYVLDVKTLAKYLDSNESKELITTLAKSKPLERWFKIRNVAPLLNILHVDDRTMFWKHVSSIEKNKGIFSHSGHVIDPVPKIKLATKDLWHDYHFNLRNFGYYQDSDNDDIQYRDYGKTKRIKKIHLDHLIEEFSIVPFDQTLADVRRNMIIETSAKKRMHLMQMVVIKSGGRVSTLNPLFDFLLRYCHETEEVRGGVVSTIAKHGRIWQANKEIWRKFNQFRQLGSEQEIKSVEALHIDVIRQLLLNGHCDASTERKYMESFSTFTNYKRSKEEQDKIGKALTKMLVDSINKNIETEVVKNILFKLLDVLHAYKIGADINDVVPTIKKITDINKSVAGEIIKRLYKIKFGRKYFGIENYHYIQTDASYFNTLKHNAGILTVDKLLYALEVQKVQLSNFLRKVSIYFGENGNLTNRFAYALKEAKVNNNLAKPLAQLFGAELNSFILLQDSKSDKESKSFSAALRANAHLSRPFNSLDWRKAGVKCIANRVLVCKYVDIKDNIEKLLQWRRSTRLALHLARRNNTEAEVFSSVAKMRPTVAFKCAVAYFLEEGDNSDVKVWEAVKPYINKVENVLRIPRHYNRRSKYNKIDSIPIKIRADYISSLFYIMCSVEPRRLTVIYLDRIMELLPEMKSEFIESILDDYFSKKIIVAHSGSGSYHVQYTREYFKLIAISYMLLCTDEEEQKRRFDFYDKHKFNPNSLSELVYNKAYLNEKYVSCLPFLEKYQKEFHNTTAIENNFDAYIKMELSKLYLKAMRDSVKLCPDLLVNTIELSKGVEIIAELFGKYVVNHAFGNDFDSKMGLYGSTLDYFLKYCVKGNTKFQIEVSMSILKENKKTKFRESASDQIYLVFDLIKHTYVYYTQHFTGFLEYFLENGFHIYNAGDSAYLVKAEN